MVGVQERKVRADGGLDGELGGSFRGFGWFKDANGSIGIIYS